MTRLLVLFALLLPAPTLAQSAARGPVSGPVCAALLPTVQADTLGPVNEDGTGFYRIDGVAPSPRVGATASIEFELSGARRIRRNQPLALSLRVTNRSAGDVTVMRAMDGSGAHMRDPSYDLYIREVGSAVVYRWDSHGVRCGMMNAVADEDYVRIAPGAVNHTLPGDWGAHLHDATVSERGQYEAWVVYRLCGDIGDVGDNGDNGPGASQTPPRPEPTPGAHRSNAVRFRIR